MWYHLVWKDIGEIIFFSCLFYYSACWLKRDKQNNLLGYALAYAVLAAVSYLLELQAISTFLLWFFPTIAVLFVLVHQDTLQKNFVCARVQKKENISAVDWIEIMLSACLLNMHYAKATSCIIEHTQDLTGLLESPFLINAPIQQELVQMLCHSQSYNEHKSIWITSHGIMRGINTSWKHTIAAPHVSSSAYVQPVISIEQALVLTSKTDALIFFLDPSTRLFTLLIHDTIFKKISAHHTQQLIKKYLTKTEKNKGIFNEHSSSATTQQHIS